MLNGYSVSLKYLVNSVLVLNTDNKGKKIYRSYLNKRKWVIINKVGHVKHLGSDGGKQFGDFFIIINIIGK